MDTTQLNVHPYILHVINSIKASFDFYSIRLDSIRPLRKKCLVKGVKQDGQNVVVTIHYIPTNLVPTETSTNAVLLLSVSYIEH